MNKNYNRGRIKEWEAKKILEKEGFTVLRTAGSHGCADIIAALYDPPYEEVWFIQIKRFKKTATTAQKHAVVNEASSKFEEARIPPIVNRAILIYQDGHGWETYYLGDAALRDEGLPFDIAPCGKRYGKEETQRGST